MCARTPALILLLSFLAFAASTTPPAAGQVKDQPKGRRSQKIKEKDKDGTKPPPKFEWPTQIGNKGLTDWLKDATENPDPAIRDGRPENSSRVSGRKPARSARSGSFSA